MSHAATDSMGGTASDRKGKANLLSVATVTGDEICNLKEKKLGTIHDIVWIS